MKCELCNKEGKDDDLLMELSWEHVDKDEYNARVKDGRNTNIQYVCSECLCNRSGVDYRGRWVGSFLSDLNREGKEKADKARKP